MFRVNVEVDGNESFPYDFSVSGEGASSLLDVLASARTRFGTPHVPYRVGSPIRLLEALDSNCCICCIVPENSNLVVIDGPMKGFENQKGLLLLLVQQLTDRSPPTAFRPLHSISCVPYVPEGIQLETMPKIEQVSFSNPKDINNPVVYDVDGGTTTTDNASATGVSFRTVNDLLKTALRLQGLGLESNYAEGISLTLTSLTTRKHIALPEDQTDELYRQKLYDLEIPGPLIHVDVERGMQVVANSIGGRYQESFPCSPYETLRDLHNKAVMSGWASVRLQRPRYVSLLNNESLQLDPGKSLAENGIGHQSEVTLVPRLGMLHPSSGRANDMYLLQFVPKKVTMHFPNGCRRVFFVRGHRDLMDAAHGYTRHYRPESDRVRETAEERVEWLRKELQLAEKDLEALKSWKPQL